MPDVFWGPDGGRGKGSHLCLVEQPRKKMWGKVNGGITIITGTKLAREIVGAGKERQSEGTLGGEKKIEGDTKWERKVDIKKKRKDRQKTLKTN